MSDSRLHAIENELKDIRRLLEQIASAVAPSKPQRRRGDDHPGITII